MLNRIFSFFLPCVNNCFWYRIFIKHKEQRIFFHCKLTIKVVEFLCVQKFWFSSEIDIGWNKSRFWMFFTFTQFFTIKKCYLHLKNWINPTIRLFFFCSFKMWYFFSCFFLPISSKSMIPSTSNLLLLFFFSYPLSNT